MYFRNVLIENFIPPEEKNKIMNRLYFDSEEDQWRLQSILPEMSVDHFHTSRHIKYYIIYINVDVPGTVTGNRSLIPNVFLPVHQLRPRGDPSLLWDTRDPSAIMPRCLLPQRPAHHVDTRSVLKVTKSEMNRTVYFYV